MGLVGYGGLTLLCLDWLIACLFGLWWFDAVAVYRLGLLLCWLRLGVWLLQVVCAVSLD